MVETLRAQNISLNDLVEEFGLEFIDEQQCFREWQENLPELTDLEKQTLDGVKANFRHLSRYPLVEAVVKLVVLAPLLNMAGFYHPPFYLTAEKEVKIESEEEGIICHLSFVLCPLSLDKLTSCTMHQKYLTRSIRAINSNTETVKSYHCCQMSR
ncbi:MAG: hypothetical protein F6K31_36740 [Symploca sp. SIO2G7]|nr:hypothetical protein [Symploca sp. SIO2G7]